MAGRIEPAADKHEHLRNRAAMLRWDMIRSEVLEECVRVETRPLSYRQHLWERISEPEAVLTPEPCIRLLFPAGEAQRVAAAALSERGFKRIGYHRSVSDRFASVPQTLLLRRNEFNLYLSHSLPVLLGSRVRFSDLWKRSAETRLGENQLAIVGFSDELTYRIFRAFDAIAFNRDPQAALDEIHSLLLCDPARTSIMAEEILRGMPGSDPLFSAILDRVNAQTASLPSLPLVERVRWCLKYMTASEWPLLERLIRNAPVDYFP